MSKRWIAAAAASACVFSIAGTASAAPVYASVVDTFNPGLRKDGNAILAPRDNPLNALGTPTQTSANVADFGGFTVQTGAFVSLGFGGSIVLRFDPFAFGPPLAVVIETTGGTYHVETATVEISSNGTSWTPIGTAVNGGTGQTSLNVPAGSWTYMRLTDTTNMNQTNPSVEPIADGFDLNSVQVNAVPLPPALWGGGALLGYVAVRRLRQQRLAAL